MKLKVNGHLFEIVLSFSTPGTLAPWQAEAYLKVGTRAWEGENLDAIVPDLVSSGTTPDTALTAVALELSEIY